MKNLRIIHIRMINGTIFAPRKSKLKKKLMMKKNLVFLLGACLLTGSMLFTGCAADDITAPVLSLQGALEDTIKVGSTYSDPGATAVDDEDGDISSSIVVTGTPSNPVSAGNYHMEYSVSDAAGNVASADRHLQVSFAGSQLSFPYNVTENCGGTQASFSMTGSSSSQSEWRVNFLNFADVWPSDPVYATIVGDKLTLPEQTPIPGGTIKLKGSGTISKSGSVITLTLSYDVTNTLSGNVTSCTATATSN